MSNQNEAGVLEDETGPEETEGRRFNAGYGLLAVAVIVIAVGTSQVLSQNADREEQARKVRDAQSRMEATTTGM